MSIEKLDLENIEEGTGYTISLNSVIQHIPNAEALAVWVELYSHAPCWIVHAEYVKNKFGFGDKKVRKFSLISAEQI